MERQLGLRLRPDLVIELTAHDFALPAVQPTPAFMARFGSYLAFYDLAI